MNHTLHRIGLCLSLWMICSGCQRLDVMRFQNSEKEKENLFAEQEVTTDYIEDKAQVVGNSVMVLYGVGLVTRLDNTGEDPPPSNYRTVLVREMNRRGVTNPNEILNDPTTALVLVTGYLSADVKKNGHFDIQVTLPPGSKSSSLAGGWLMETYLWEKAQAPTGQELTGRAYAIASGPILLSVSDESETKTPALLKRGKVLGGGIAKIDRDLGIFLRSDFKGARNSKRVADRIGERFHDHSDRGIKVSMAKAKDDQFIELKVHPYYKNNYPRYMKVIGNIVF
ncbi:MAG: flagellar basal body P-ring protein FlgI, partial [Planctomycetaceae bacterium]|nr:flagellar basal body P-ring protein FlgI [Planctomycetaceae bacterium]